MKKPIFLTLGLCLGLFTTGANAKTFSQSAGAGNFEVSASLETYKFDTNMSSTTGTIPVGYFNDNFEAPVDRDIFMLRGAYGILNEMDVFVGLGYVNEKWTADDSFSGYKESGKNPMFEIGIKGTGFKALQDKMYVSYLLKYSYLKSGEDFSGPNIPDSSEVVYQERSIGIETGYTFDSIGLTPYAGVSYFDINGKQKLDNYVGVANYDSEFDNEKKVGCYLGLDYKLTEKASVGIQADFFVKKGAQLGATYVF